MRVIPSNTAGTGLTALTEHTALTELTTGATGTAGTGLTTGATGIKKGMPIKTFPLLLVVFAPQH